MISRRPITRRQSNGYAVYQSQGSCVCRLEAWYDEFAQKRKEKGVTAASVHRDGSDPTLVTVTHQFADLAAAQVFAGWEELRSAMMKGGVEGPPDIWFTEDIEQTAH